MSLDSLADLDWPSHDARRTGLSSVEPVPTQFERSISRIGPTSEGQRAAFMRDCLDGLSQPQKAIPCKWLYDDVGSQLFERICELPEYYPSRTEMLLLEQAIPTLTDVIAYGSTLIELGSGASRKTRKLLNAVPAFSTYVPIDISPHELERATAMVRSDYLGLKVRPLCADFSDPYALDPGLMNGPCLTFFPGSTIGNMLPDQATRFLTDLRLNLGTKPQLLLGIDLLKDRQILEAAYDDGSGITAAFNLNLLARINRDLGGSIDLGSFSHRAIWNAEESRIEMHLVAACAQILRIGSTIIPIRAGETIHTENSYKLRRTRIERMFADAGWRVRGSWASDDPAFLMCLLSE